MGLARIYSRYYCPDDHRVFPYDTLETLTEIQSNPEGGIILLRSYNGKSARKRAWCFACGEWVDALRRSQHAILLDYIDRPGVSIRSDRTSKRALAETLAAVVEQKRKQ